VGLVLREIWQSRLWIACDCRSLGGAAPILFVRWTGAMSCQLAHVAERASHASGCPSARSTL
jgi:hypothetical protein